MNKKRKGHHGKDKNKTTVVLFREIVEYRFVGRSEREVGRKY